MSTHTPGPWAIDEKTMPIIVTAQGTGKLVARVLAHTQQTHPEYVANARLIVSAPDLLYALKGLLRYVDQSNLDESHWTRTARQIIVKAEGKGVDHE